MSYLNDLQFNLDMNQLSGFLTDNMGLIMPILVAILGLLFADKILEILIDKLLMVMAFVVGDNRSKRSARDQDFNLDIGANFGNFDADFATNIFGGRSRRTANKRKAKEQTQGFAIEMDFDADFSADVFDSRSRHRKSDAPKKQDFSDNGRKSL